MENFDFKPNWGMQLNREPKVITLSFGDGYEQRLKMGLNHNLRRYSLSFSGSIEKMVEIEAFLNRHEGYKAFYWTPRYGDQGKFKCEKWQLVNNEVFAVLSCEFQEVVA